MLITLSKVLHPKLEQKDVQRLPIFLWSALPTAQNEQ